MNSRFSLTKHASGSGGTLRAQVQQITWRESLARWIMAGLQSLWTLKHAGKGMLSLLLVLVGWGVVMPAQAELIAWYPCETDAKDHKPSGGKYANHDGSIQGVEFALDTFLNRTVCQFNKPAEGKTPKITGRYIEVPYSADFDLDSGPFTLSACVYQTKRNDTYTGIIFANRGMANGWLFGVAGKADSKLPGSLKFRVNDNWDSDAIRSWAKIPNAESSPPPQWHSVALVYNGTTAQMYMDGGLVGSESSSSPGIRTPGDTSLFIGKNSETYLGKDVNDHHYWWYGQMSDLRIEDKVLTLKEIGALDNRCRQWHYGSVVNRPNTLPKIKNPLAFATLSGGKVTLNASATDEEDDKEGYPVTIRYSVPTKDGMMDYYAKSGEQITVPLPSDDYAGLFTIVAQAIDSQEAPSVPGIQSIPVKAPNTAPTSCFFTTPPTVSAVEAPAVGQPPKKVTFTVCGGTLDDTTPTADFKYQWLVNGQVQSTNPGSFDLSIDGTGDYTKLDDYKVELIVTDKEGLSTPVDDPVKMQKPTVVQVEPFNQPPVACFAIKDPVTKQIISSGSAPLAVELDASCSSDDGNNGKPVKYTWTMFLQNEDGSFGNTPWKGPFDSVEPILPTQKLETGGKYQVKLTVEDDGKPTAKQSTEPATNEVTVNKKVFMLQPAGCSYPTGEECELTNLIPGKPFNLTVRVSEYVLEQHPVDGVSFSMTFPKDKLQITGVSQPDKPALDDLLSSSKLEKANADGIFKWSATVYENEAVTKADRPNGFDLVTISFAFKEGINNDPISLKTDARVDYSGQSRTLDTEPTNLIFKSETTSIQQGTVTWKGRVPENPFPFVPEGEKTMLSVWSVTGGISTQHNSIVVRNDGSFDFPTLPDKYGYLCIKGKNTLATKIMWPGTSAIELYQGSTANDDWKVDEADNPKPLKNGGVIPACQLDSKGNLQHYNALADLDGKGCVNNIKPSDMDCQGALDAGVLTGDKEIFCESYVLSDSEYSVYEKTPGEQTALCFQDSNGNVRKGQRSNSNGQITFQTTPIPTGLTVGATFDVTVLVNSTATQSVDGAATYLNFDPQRLKVNSLTAGSSLDFVLKKKFDNTQGQVNVAAMLWANDYPADTFSLVTINFTLLGENGERTLSFNTTAPRETAAALAGQYVNAPVQPSAIKFAEKPLTYVISDYLMDQAGQPLAGVTIHIGDQTAVTNENGYWKITDLPEGSYTVTAQKDDYTFTTAPCALSREQLDCQMVKPKSLLKLTVDYPPEVTQQQEFDYTITVTNGSPQTVTGVTLTDTLPNGVAALSLDAATGGQCDLSTLTCNGFTLDAGASATFKLHVINLQSETLNNTLTVTANEQPAAVKTVTTTVKPDLSVTVKDTPDPVGMLKDLQYEVTVALADQATSAATGVTLELTLPTGVTLKTLTLEQGQCDTTTQLPKVICHLDDLSLEGVKQVPLTLTTSLHDAGLLLLTLQAQLSSNEYATMTVRERTKVFVPPEIKVDLALVIDTTNSMQGEIDGVKAALNKFMATTDPNTAPLVALITFKDEVTVKAFTRDLNVLLKVIDSLKAEGGGTCPEASVEALAFTVVHVKKGGQIWFTTDASPYPDADIDGLTKLLQDNETVLNATITGDCSMVDSVNDAQWEDVVNGK